MVDFTQFKKGISIDNMEEFIQNIKADITGKGSSSGVVSEISKKVPSFVPTWGKKTVAVPKPTNVFIPYGIEYEEPPSVIAVNRGRPLSLRKLAYKLEQFSVKVSSLPVVSVAEAQIKKPLVQGISVPDLSFSFDMSSMPTLSDISKDFVASIPKLESQIKGALKEIKMSLPSFEFPSLPKMTTWDVKWFKVTDSGGSMSDIANYMAKTSDYSSTGEAIVRSGDVQGFKVDMDHTREVEVEGTVSTIDINQDIDPVSLQKATEQYKEGIPLPDYNNTTTGSTTTVSPSTDENTDYTESGTDKTTSTSTSTSTVSASMYDAGDTGGIPVNFSSEPIGNTEFSGLFNFNFTGGGNVISNFKNKIGFVAISSIKLSKDSSVTFIVGGRDGYRLSVDGVEVINNWGTKTLPSTSKKVIELSQGTHTLTLSWYVWDGIPIVFFFMFPPPIQDIPVKYNLDLSATLRDAMVSAYLFGRDKLDYIYNKYLPSYDISLPRMKIDYHKHWTIAEKTFGVDISLVLFKGADWKIDFANPLIYANDLFFKETKGVPGWFGASIGTKISSAINSAFKSLSDMITSTYHMITDLLKTTMDSLVDHLTSFSKDLNDNLVSFSSSVQEEFNDKFSQLKDTLETNFDSLAQSATDSINNGLKVVDLRSDARVSRVISDMKNNFDKISTVFNKYNSDLESVLNTAFTDFASAMEESINTVLKDMTKNINSALIAYNKIQKEAIETAINDAVKLQTMYINTFMNKYITLMLDQLGLPTEYSFSPVYIEEIRTDGFVVKALAGENEYNWIAIGKPKISGENNSVSNVVSKIEDVFMP